jgi:hypothetical protein
VASPLKGLTSDVTVTDLNGNQRTLAEEVPGLKDIVDAGLQRSLGWVGCRRAFLATAKDKAGFFARKLAL